MSHDVMISFSSKNLPMVGKILQRLEDAGLRCWVSYRDVKQGANYQESITGAIRTAGAVLFVMCREFNLSEETKRELSLASYFKKPMLPIRMEEFELSDALVYSLATVQYINAFPDFDVAVEKTIARLKELVAANAASVPDHAPPAHEAAPAAPIAAPTNEQRYADIARQVYADGIVTPEERGRLDMARELLSISADDAGRIESRFGTLAAPSAPQPLSAAPAYAPPAPPWSGYWMVNVGEGIHRTWDDNRRFGYMGAGQGVRYRTALQRLSVGDRIFAYLKGCGYVGFGEVTRAAVMIRDFMLDDGTCILQHDMRAPLAAEHADDPERCEWAVAVRWIKTLPPHAAVKFPNIFSSQHAVCKLRDEKTLEVLRATLAG